MSRETKTAALPSLGHDPQVNTARSLCLTYHRVAVEPSKYPYTMTSRQFEDHLECVSRLRNDASGRYVRARVTFDDGHSSNHSQAAPLLAKYEVTAQFFLTAGWIGSRPDFMDWAQARELHSAGFAIGSHGWSHRLLTRCSDSELDVELRRSKGVLEDRLGVPISTLSMPGGRWDRRVLRACAAAGYECIFSSDPTGTVVRREGVQLTSRVNIASSMRAQQLCNLLKVHGGGLRRLAMLHHAKCTVRRIVGERLYHDLWCAVHGWQNDEAD